MPTCTMTRSGRLSALSSALASGATWLSSSWTWAGIGVPVSSLWPAVPEPWGGEHRVGVGDQQRDHGEAGERRHRLARRGDGGDQRERGQPPGEAAGEEGDAEHAAGVERSEEMARPPQPESAEKDGTRLE